MNMFQSNRGRNVARPTLGSSLDQQNNEDQDNTLSAMTNEIELPEVVPYSVFNTINTMRQFIINNNLGQYVGTETGRLRNDIARDLRQFLTDQGYAINQQGDFVRHGGLTISGGLEFNDLVTVNNYFQFIQTPGQIPITQIELVRMNISMNNLLSKIPQRRWQNLEQFVEQVSKAINVGMPAIWLASLITRLNRERAQTYSTVLASIGDTRTFRTSEQRLNGILDYFRQKISPTPRTYNRREVFKGPAKTTMTMEQAIREGYQFNDDQYKEDIDRLLDHVSVPKTHRQYLVQLIQLYPEMYDIMRLFNASIQSFTRALIKLYYTEEPSMVQILYTFAVNAPLIFPESPEKAQRRQLINSLPRSYLDTLYQIYGIRNTEEILNMPQNPLELYLAAIVNTKLQQLPALAMGFGMVIPEHLLTREIRAYILQFMHEYRNVITREPTIAPINRVINSQPENVIDLINALNRYTDQEIMESFGYVGGFTNRNVLIENIFQTISQEGFMVYRKIDPEKCINTETTLLTEIQDIIPPFLVFGTPFRYRVIELDELIAAFYEERNSENEITSFKFTKIGGNTNAEVYTISQVSRLQALLPAVKNMNNQLSVVVDEIITRIRSGIIRLTTRNAQIDRIIRDVKRTPEEIQELIKEIFYKIFYAGMYMRRWRGPGNRYPIQASQTRGGTDPEPKSIATLGEIYNILERLSNFNSSLSNQILQIPQINYNTRADSVIIANQLIFNIIDRVVNGTFCIRQASKYLIQTAHYYLGVMFGEIIPNFDPYSVESIS